MWPELIFLCQSACRFSSWTVPVEAWDASSCLSLLRRTTNSPENTVTSHRQPAVSESWTLQRTIWVQGIPHTKPALPFCTTQSASICLPLHISHHWHEKGKDPFFCTMPPHSCCYPKLGGTGGSRGGRRVKKEQLVPSPQRDPKH